MLCSCRLNAQTEQPDPTCAICDGSGFRYVNPELYDRPEVARDWVELKGILSSISLDTNIYHEPGEMTHGTAVLTLPGEADAGYRDRFVSMEHEMTYSEVLIRGAGALVDVGHGGRSTSERREVTRYPPIKINFVGDDTTIWYPLLDFNLREAGFDGTVQLEWLTGRGPAAGARYSLHYTCRPTWIVEESMYGVQNAKGPPSSLKGTKVIQSLPKTYRVRLDWLTQGVT